MKIAYFHCFAGAAGDMIVGALLDAGLPWEQLEADMALLDCGGFRLERRKVAKGGLLGTKFEVHVHDDKTRRSIKEIRSMLEASGLPDAVRQNSAAVFTRLAEAEARVHGVAVEEVIFHRLGAIDAIVDVVGAAAGLWRLGIEEVYASPVNVGSGFAQSGHGIIPVPGPATMELLTGVPVYSYGADRELLTPTGAAILTTFCRSFGDMPPLLVSGNGYGAGDHDLAIPNLLRVTIGEKPAGGAASAETDDGCLQAPALMMEANIDDMNPELYDYLISRLLEEGAMDVFLQTIQMKKNRPAVTLCVLMRPEDEARFRGRIFSETTTLGLRVYPVTKYMLPSEVVALETPLGRARVKVGRRAGKIVSLAPEYEDCRSLARENNLPLKEVYEIVRAEGRLKIPNSGDIHDN